MYNIAGISTPISTGYEIPFRIFESSDVNVTISLDTGAETPVSAGWTVQEPSSDTGVYKVVFNQGYTFPSGSQKLIISRSVPAEQNVDLRNGDAVDAEVLEEMFDRQTAVSQQIAEEANRALKFPISETPEGSTLPEASQRQGKVIGFADNGTDLVLYGNIDQGIADAAEALAQANAALDEAAATKEAAETAREGAEAAEDGAEQALADTKQAKTDALAAIGEDNQSGARGDAIEAIEAQKESSVSSVETAEEAALAAIGQSDTAGARGAAISSINSTKSTALSEIDTTKEAALDAVGETDTEGARGDAIASIEEKATGANEIIDGKVDTATDAASAAAGSASDASQSAQNAATSEANAKSSEKAAKASEDAAKSSETAAKTAETNAKTSETNAKSSETAALSSKNAAASSESAAADSESNALQYKRDAEAAKAAAETAQGKAEDAQAAAEEAAEQAAAIADIGIASPTEAGITKMYQTARGQNTDGGATQKSIDDAFKTVEGSISTQQSNLSTLQQAVTQQGARLSTAEGKISTLEGKVSTAESKIGTLEGKMDDAEGSIGTLQSDLESAEQAIGSLEDDVGTLQDDMTAVEQSIENIGSSIMLPIPEIEYSSSSAGDGGTLEVMNTWTGYSGVSVRAKNGSEPASATDGIAVSGSTSISGNGTWYVRAFSPTNQASPSAIFTVAGQKCQAPVFSYDDEAHLVTLTAQTSGSQIRYTLNGAEPTSSSTLYSGPFTVVDNCTVKAKAFKSGLIDSDTVSGEAIVARIFAVRWNYGASSTKLTRLTPSSDPLGLVTETITTDPVPAKSTTGGSSPFDAYGPWNGMKCRNFIDDGNGNFIPDAWSDESGFSRTTKDTMVWIPQFWIKTVDNAASSLRDYYISDGPKDGFTLHPGSGMYVGAYVTSNNNQSRSGKSFQVNQSITTMRTSARTKGTGWELVDIAARNALQYLFIVEFADMDSQEIFDQTSGTQNSTGLTDTLSYHTGYNGKVRYRWVEDLWNGVYEWTDGFNTVSGHHYVSTDRADYQSDVTAGYTDLGSWGINGEYIKKLKYFANMPWLISIPEAGGGSSSTYVPDYAYLSSSSTYVLGCGGSWGSYDYHGLFYFYANGSSSYSGSNFGSRLSYKEAA